MVANLIRVKYSRRALRSNSRYCDRISASPARLASFCRSPAVRGQPEAMICPVPTGLAASLTATKAASPPETSATAMADLSTARATSP